MEEDLEVHAQTHCDFRLHVRSGETVRLPLPSALHTVCDIYPPRSTGELCNIVDHRPSTLPFSASSAPQFNSTSLIYMRSR